MPLQLSIHVGCSCVQLGARRLTAAAPALCRNTGMLQLSLACQSRIYLLALVAAFMVALAEAFVAALVAVSAFVASQSGPRTNRGCQMHNALICRIMVVCLAELYCTPYVLKWEDACSMLSLGMCSGLMEPLYSRG